MAISAAQAAMRKGQLAEAHAKLDELVKLLPRDSELSSKEHNLEQHARKAKFLIETHVFAGSFHSKLVDQLRQEYVSQLSYGSDGRPPQRRFVPYASTL